MLKAVSVVIAAGHRFILVLCVLHFLFHSTCIAASDEFLNFLASNRNMQQMAQEMLLLFRISSGEIKPLLDLQKALKERAFLSFWERMAPPENLMQKKEEPKIEIKKITESIGPKISEKGKQEEVETYTISYYNPTLKKQEVLETKVMITIDDAVRKKIEEATGAQTLYPVYAFITTPIITKEVNPYLLEEILNKREYDAPPPSGGAAPVRIVVKDMEAEKISEAKGAIVEAIKRKESAEEKVASEIAVLEYVIEKIKKGGNARSVVKQLGPLTRARFLAALRKKGISKDVLLLLLARDVDFLKSIKKKLETLTVDGLVELVKAMGTLQKIR